ncbi:MAG: hypothetical protein EP330_09425 [Deltaproteobacteria bacterium]|nr:MAG: hypothetical protein EP330_09425 [Deltaproteobacteria bacterium]
MFFDEARIERAQKQERIRRWMRPLTVVLAFVAAAMAGLAWLLTTPSGLAFLLERATQGAPFDVSLESIELNPGQTAVATDRWRIVLHELDIEPRDPDRAHITAHRVELDTPSLRDILQIGEVDLGHIRIDGLDIHTNRQRPPPEWEARKTFIRAVRARVVEAYDVNYRAEPDPPLDVAAMGGIEARLERVVWAPGNREISGRGTLKAKSFQTGTLVLDGLEVDDLRVLRSDLTFGHGTFTYGGGQGTLTGEVLHFNRKAQATFEVGLTGARAEQMVSAATGRPSPLYARVDGSLTVHSGGDLPRGGGWMNARVRLTGGIFPLGSTDKPLIRDMLRVAPFMEVDDEDRVILGDIAGRLRLDRGTVLLHDLEYQAPRRTLMLWGDIQPDKAEVVFRAVPPSNADKRAGFGLVAFYEEGDENFRFRLGRKADLLPERKDGESLGASVRRRLQAAE